jgi:oligopeptide transport system substrate-binding protein
MQDNLGITITLEPMESKAFQQMVNAEQHTWAWFGWGADYPDPENWLPAMFETGAGNNHTLYSNPAFDALCEQGKYELDDAKRAEIWAKAAKILSDDSPIVTVFYRERFWLAKPNVKDLITTAMDGQIPGDLFFFKTNLSD